MRASVCLPVYVSAFAVSHSLCVFACVCMFIFTKLTRLRISDAFFILSLRCATQLVLVESFFSQKTARITACRHYYDHHRL